MPDALINFMAKKQDNSEGQNTKSQKFVGNGSSWDFGQETKNVDLMILNRLLPSVSDLKCQTKKLWLIQENGTETHLSWLVDFEAQ